MRYKITIEYDGTNYSGWQRQDKNKSIQEALSNSLKALTQGHLVNIHGSGRTDAGVHAVAQCAHFDLYYEYEKAFLFDNHHFFDQKKFTGLEFLKNQFFLKNQITPQKIQTCMNFFLPKDICVTSINEVSYDFHARFSAKKRSYVYLIQNRPFRTCLLRHNAWFIRNQLNIDLMNSAAKVLLGRHDFTSFRGAGCQSPSPFKCIDDIFVCDLNNYCKSLNGQLQNLSTFSLIQDKSIDLNLNFQNDSCNLQKLLFLNQDCILLYIQSKSFLYHQVRNIVGTLVKVGKMEISVDQFQDILHAKDRKVAGITAPACGLYFLETLY